MNNMIPIIHHYPRKEVPGIVYLLNFDSKGMVPLYELPVNQEDKDGPSSEVVSATLQTEDTIVFGATDGTIVEIDKNGNKRGIYGPRQISRWDEKQKRRCKEPAVIYSLTEHNGVIYDAGSAGFFETRRGIQRDNRNIRNILFMNERLGLYIYGPSAEKQADLEQAIAEHNALCLEDKIDRYVADSSEQNLAEVWASMRQSKILEYTGTLAMLQGECPVGIVKSALLLAPIAAFTKLEAEAQVGWLIDAETKQQMWDVHGELHCAPHYFFFHDDIAYAFNKIREEGMVSWQVMMRERSTGKIRGLRYGPAVAGYTFHEGEPYLLFANGAGNPLDRAREIVLVRGRGIENDGEFLVVGENSTVTGMVSVDSKIVIGLYDRETDTTRFVTHTAPKEPLHKIQGLAYLTQ